MICFYIFKFLLLREAWLNGVDGGLKVEVFEDDFDWWS